MFHPCIEKLKDPAVLDRLRADTDGRCPRIWAEKTYAAFDLKTMPDLSYSLRMTFERTSAREPARFKEIDFLMKSIRGENIVPREFTALYETFKKVVKTNK